MITSAKQSGRNAHASLKCCHVVVNQKRISDRALAVGIFSVAGCHWYAAAAKDRGPTSIRLHLYAFTAACAFFLLADGLDSLWAGFFFPVEVITSACSTVLLLIAVIKRKRATFALVGSGSLIGYFASILTVGFHDLGLAAAGMVFAPNEVIVWINTLFLFLMLPVALAAGVLSFARALSPLRHKAATVPAIRRA